MKLGHLLIDEFTVLHEATSAHYLRNDQETAFQLRRRLRERLDASPLDGLDDEKKLIDSLHARIAFLSGHGSEASANLTVREALGPLDSRRASTAASTSSAAKRWSSRPTTTWFAAVDAGDEEYQSNEQADLPARVGPGVPLPDQGRHADAAPSPYGRLGEAQARARMITGAARELLARGARLLMG